MHEDSCAAGCSYNYSIIKLVHHIEMRKTDCFGKTRLVPHVPSSSLAGKRCYYDLLLLLFNLYFRL